MSREKKPKQLLSIIGTETLLQQTVARVLPLIPREKIFIVTNASLADEIVSQLFTHFGGSWKSQLIIEPEAKNTAPAIGLAAIHLERIDPEEVMVVLPADHVIQNPKKFLEILLEAEQAAKQGYLVTLGITPTRPETGYGYIQTGESALKNTFHVKRFVEKPDIQKAKEYLSSSGYFWNSGMFVWKTNTLLQGIEAYLPNLFSSLTEIQKSIANKTVKKTAELAFSKIDSVSIDYGLMEKASNVVIIPADMGWSDVGSWDALEEVMPKDSSGNVTIGNVLDIESSNSFLYADRRLVATLGLKDTIVVDTPDATLICSKDRAQEVKKIVSELKKRNAEEYLIHRTIYRPWGSYTILEESERYKIKRIVVHPGAKLSYQMHYHRSEHWVVVSGTARVTNGDREYDIHPNESTYIPVSTKHRLENIGKIPLQIIEVQNGEYLGEDDIVRFEDDYARQEGWPLLPEIPT